MNMKMDHIAGVRASVDAGTVFYSRPIRIVLCLLLCTALTTVRADLPPFDQNTFYRLTTEWQGACRSLDVINAGNNDQVALRPTAHVSGQHWRITPAGNGFVRLTTRWQGPGKSLDIVNDGPNDRPALANTGNFSGQFWKIEPAGDGFVRLTTAWQGEGRSLDIVNDGNNDLPRLRATANVAGQRWLVSRETAVSPPPSSLNLNPFYRKYLDADGIPVVGSQNVPDEAFYRVRDISRHMLARLPQVLQSLIFRNVRIAIMAATEVTTDIPEHSFLANDPNVDWDQRARGLGATVLVPVSSCAEENLLCQTNDPYSPEDIFTHEFAHTIFRVGLAFTNPDFQGKLVSAFLNARQNHLWDNTYANTDIEEYFAEGVQNWFNVNDEAIPTDGTHNHVNTRAELLTHDPTLHALLAEHFAADQYKCSCH